jgi:murein DD-endopeptidase MepM/ murein hydrolase activator NlpD
MKRISSVLLLVACISFSCSSTLHKIFNGHKTPHEEYAEKLEDKNLDNTAEGRAWLAASKKALEAPQSIQLPYKQTGYFHPDKPRSLGLKFRAKQGEKLLFILNKKLAGLVIYSDLFKTNSTSTSLLSADTSSSQFSFDVEETGDYILRLQPELFRSGEYSLTISIGPSLGFPVLENKASIGSFWGDGRDGGKRSHEGIDIFASKHSPAIAAADGYITGVREGGIGGKTVWLRPEGKNYTLYYAHLDKQLVREGQFVKKGETVGLVGNTGNAKQTPSHLHFGVYTYKGAIDPLPFINKTIKTAPDVPSKNLTVALKLIKSKKVGEAFIKANALLTPLAVTSKFYIAETIEGNLMQISFNEVKPMKQDTRSAYESATNSVKSQKQY